MTDIIQLAQGVAAAIEGAEVMFAPEYALYNLHTKRIVVVPIGLETKPKARGYYEEHLRVQIGLLARCTEDEVPSLIREVTQLGRSFLQKWIAGVRCVKAEYSPLYAPEHLRERRQFTGVVELTFISVEQINEDGN